MSFIGLLNVLRVLVRDYLRWEKTGALPWETEQEAERRKWLEEQTSKSAPPKPTPQAPNP
jgi:hypothetical protein